jgi:hypothetical protein|tara:strand:- start:3115 stop:3525 length:411 start_codon:yes stop_codon:yes gene_type:complete
MVFIGKDLQFGLEAEDKILSILQNKVDINITPTPQFHSFDYFCSSTKTYYELKTRRVKHDTYPDTMCGACKLKFAKEHPENKYVFLFNFTDGLYYHNWKEDKLYDIKIGGRYDRGRPELNEYFYIKKNDLAKFENI